MRRDALTTALAQMSADDQVVKGVFDHLRNLGLCAVVFLSGGWMLNRSELWPLWFVYPMASLAWACALFLFFLNQWHAILRLQKAGASKASLLIFMIG